jgi:tetratricopeptide (TPR) repeat protein
LRTIIHEVETVVGPDPELRKTTDWESLLTNWEGVARELLRFALRYRRRKDDAWILFSTEAAWLELRLMDAIIVPMTRHGHRHQKIFLDELALPSYQIGMLLKAWEDAARIAYHAAHTYDDLYSTLTVSEGQAWVQRLEYCIEQLKQQGKSNEELQLMLLDVQGVFFKDYKGEPARARECFEKALHIAKKLGSSRWQGRIYVHLGELEELEGNLDMATKYYEQAYHNIGASGDSDRQLYCAYKWARITFVNDQHEKAYELYSKLLDLSHHSQESHYWASQAHEGIASALLKRADNLTRKANQSEEAYQRIREMLYRDAYHHIRQALMIEEAIDRTSKRANALREHAIKIMDTILKLP